MSNRTKATQAKATKATISAAELEAAVNTPAPAPVEVIPNTIVDAIDVITVPIPGKDEVIDAEVVEGPAPLTTEEAEALDKEVASAAAQTADSLGHLADLVQQARIGQIHIGLGFPSWTAWFADRVTAPLMAVGERKSVALMLHNEGMGERAIGQVLGVSQPTVHNDIKAAKAAAGQKDTGSSKTVGKDGKTYTRKPKAKAAPKPKAQPKATPPKPEPVDGPKKSDLQVITEIAFADAENIVEDLEALTRNLEKLYATEGYVSGGDKEIRAKLTEARKLLTALPKAPAKKKGA